MPTRDTAPIGAPCWVDLTTSDTDASRAFYGELFEWGSEDPNEEFGGYFSFTKDGVQVAGGMAKQPGMDFPDLWSVYLATDDAQKTVDAAVANGGQLHIEPMAVAELGTMAFVSDSGGAMVGLWQPGSYQGLSVLGETGTPAWFELFTRDYQSAVDFYREVFRWDTRTEGDTPEFRYTTLAPGDDQLAGIMGASAFLPEGVPAHWSVYFRVDDADAALAEVTRLGGSVETPAEETPYGRLAVAADATGARFKLLGPNTATP